MKRNKVQQPVSQMFEDFSDLPLFSGTPVTVDYTEFKPQPVVKPQAQPTLPGIFDWLDSLTNVQLDDKFYALAQLPGDVHKAELSAITSILIDRGYW